MTWQGYNLDNLFPQEVADLITQIGSVSDSVATAAETIATAVEALSELIIDVSDPLQVVIDALIMALENTVLDTLSTGIYFYYDSEGYPFTPPRGFISWRGRFERSFDDPADSEKPDFSPTAEIGAIMIIGGANDLPSLALLLGSLGQLFGLQAYIDAYSRFLDNAFGDEPLDDLADGIPAAPDWYSITAGEAIPPLQNLASAVQSVIGLLKVASAFSAMLTQLAQALNDKAETLREIADQIDAILDQILAVLQYSGLYVTTLESTSGIEGIKDALDSAGDPPGLQADSYVVGVCLLTGMADYSKLLELFGL